MSGLTDAEREALADCDDWEEEVETIERILADHDAAWVTKIEALADEWESELGPDETYAPGNVAGVLRALLSAEGKP